MGSHHHSAAQGHRSSNSFLSSGSFPSAYKYARNSLNLQNSNKNILSLDLTSCSGYCPFLFLFTSKHLEKLTYICSSKFFHPISPQPTSVKFWSPVIPLKLLLPSSSVTSCCSSQSSYHLTCQPHLTQFITPFSLIHLLGFQDPTLGFQDPRFSSYLTGHAFSCLADPSHFPVFLTMECLKERASHHFSSESTFTLLGVSSSLMALNIISVKNPQISISSPGLSLEL